MERRFKKGGPLAVFWGLSVTVVAAIWIERTQWKHLFYACLEMLFLLPAIILLVLCLASLLIHIPFGPDAMLWSIRVPVTAESAPRGEVELVQETRYSDFDGHLAHSELYEQEWVAMNIAEWAAQKVTSLNR